MTYPRGQWVGIGRGIGTAEKGKGKGIMFQCEIEGCECETFVATGLGIAEVGVQVTKDGRVTNFYGDGIIGVTEDEKETAADESEVMCFEHRALAKWVNT